MWHSALLRAQIVMRLMRQVYFCINISSKTELPSAFQLTWTATQALYTHFQASGGCTWMPRFQPSSSSYNTNQTSRFSQTACEKMDKISLVLKHFLPSFLPPTVGTESAGLLTRVMWKAFNRHPLTPLHCHAWALGRAEICTGSPQSSVWDTLVHICSYFSLEMGGHSRTRAQFKYRYSGCELQSTKHV